MRRGEEYEPLQRLLSDSPEDRDQRGDVPPRAFELLRSMDELQIPVGLKQRLLFRLGPGKVSRPRPLGWLRTAAIGAALTGIGGAAVASANHTKWHIAVLRYCRELVSQSVDPALPANVPAGRSALKGVAPLAPPSSEPPLPRPVSAEAQPRPRAEVRARRVPAQVLSLSDDADLLVEAARALRVAREPTRARALARRYLERQPSGPLADEALAISMEAAFDHRDPDAATLGAKYLARFPHGAFRALAERILTSPQ